MKHYLLPATALLILASASSVASASVSFDGQPRYQVGEINTAPKHLNVIDTFRQGSYQDQLDEQPAPVYVEDSSDPLVGLPQQAWMVE